MCNVLCMGIILYSVQLATFHNLVVLISLPLQALMVVGALFGAPIAWPISDQLGRKPALILMGIPALIGWLMITYAYLMPTQAGFLTMLLLGRIFTGVTIGWSSFCVSVSKFCTMWLPGVKSRVCLDEKSSIVHTKLNIHVQLSYLVFVYGVAMCLSESEVNNWYIQALCTRLGIAIQYTTTNAYI